MSRSSQSELERMVCPTGLGAALLTVVTMARAVCRSTPAADRCVLSCRCWAFEGET